MLFFFFFICISSAIWLRRHSLKSLGWKFRNSTGCLCGNAMNWRRKPDSSNQDLQHLHTLTWCIIQLFTPLLLILAKSIARRKLFAAIWCQFIKNRTFQLYLQNSQISLSLYIFFVSVALISPLPEMSLPLFVLCSSCISL